MVGQKSGIKIKKQAVIILSIFIVLIGVFLFMMKYSFESENKILIEYRELKTDFKNAKGFINDDEKKIGDIRLKAERLLSQCHDEYLKKKIEDLLDKCEEEL